VLTVEPQSREARLWLVKFNISIQYTSFNSYTNHQKDFRDYELFINQTDTSTKNTNVLD